MIKTPCVSLFFIISLWQQTSYKYDDIYAGALITIGIETLLRVFVAVRRKTTIHTYRFRQVLRYPWGSPMSDFIIRPRVNQLRFCKKI